MTPGARIQAAIELLDQILISWESPKRFPADKQLDLYFKARRFIGSGDRGQISERIYWILRHKGSIGWWIERAALPLNARAYVLASVLLRKEYNQHSIHMLAKDGKYAIAPLSEEEKKFLASLENALLNNPQMPDHVRLNYPLWLEDKLRDSFGKDFEHAVSTLNTQATTDLRANTLKTERDALRAALAKDGFESELTPMSPIGLRLNKRAPVFTSASFKEGAFEVQDEGSQMIALLVDAQPGQRVIDFCAGAGGKTLAIAAQMKNKGRILALDTSEKRLKQMSQRLKRAGVDNVQIHPLASEQDAFLKRHKHTADRVLVDAPCSGTGTWRRNPDMKWRFTPQDLEEILPLQQSILRSAARLVKPGGRLIYATCSILKDENERQIEQFLKDVNDFRVVCAQKVWDKTLPTEETDQVSYLWVTPHQDGVDGFFAAVLERLPAVSPRENEVSKGNGS